MEYTENYALRKPGLNEYANVGDLNFNADKIDSQMKKNQDVDGEVYDPTSTSANAYEAGDYVINPDDGLMYVCNGTTYGTWDATKWDHTTEFEELQKAMASGGESELADLHDVEITNPTDGQALLYDPTSLKWHNSDLPDADVTKTASGNPIEISDGADAPLVKCVTQITGSQDLHGYDKPWVGGAGKNKLKVTVDGIKSANGGASSWTGNSKTINSCTWTIETDSAGNVTGLRANTNGSALVNQSILYLDEFTGLSGDFLLSGGLTNNAYITIRLNAAWSQIYSYSKTQGTQVSFTSTDSLQFVLAVNANQTVNDVFLPMLRLEQGTDGSFEQWENKSPITAYTEGEIEVRGKNLFDYTQGQNISVFQSGATMTFAPSDARIVALGGKVKNGETYTFSFPSGIKIATMFYYENDTLPLNQGSGSIVGTNISVENASGAYTFTATETNYVYFYFAPTQGQTTLPISTLSTAQMEEGSVATTYEPYTSTTHTTTFPSAIYRGSEDCVNGSVVSEYNIIDLGDLTWYKSGSMFYSESVTDFKRGTPYNNRYYANAICSHYAYGVNDDPDATITLYYDSSSSLYRLWVNDPTKASMTPADFKAAMSGVQFVYELATPTTSFVTPTNLPIKSLSGFNHIESTTGNLEIEYFPAKEQPLIDLIPEASNMHTYSTAEHAVGTWIDGETIYERTIDLGSFSIGSGGTYIIEEATDIDLLIDYDGYVIESSIMYALPDPSIRIKMESNKDLIFSGTANWDVTSGYLTIRYTKTSSNNRSLAKSAPQEEQVEELKEEPTEEIKEEPTEEVKEEPEEPVEEVKEEVKEEETKEEGEVNER